MEPYRNLSSLRLVTLGGLLLTLLAPLTLGSGPIVIEGDGRIVCDFSAPWLGLPCDLRLRGTEYEFGTTNWFAEPQTGVVGRVEMVVTWTATSRFSEELRMFIASTSNACHEAGNISHGCDSYHAQGRSPMTAAISGLGASNATLWGGVFAPHACDYSSGISFVVDPRTCRVPPATVVMDQPFHYTWTIYPN